MNQNGQAHKALSRRPPMPTPDEFAAKLTALTERVAALQAALQKAMAPKKGTDDDDEDDEAVDLAKAERGLAVSLSKLDQAISDAGPRDVGTRVALAKARAPAQLAYLRLTNPRAAEAYAVSRMTPQAQAAYHRGRTA